MTIYVPELSQFKLGDRVERRANSGLQWTGTVIAVFYTLDGKIRYVVERTAPVAGGLNIYHAAQLRQTFA